MVIADSNIWVDYFNDPDATTGLRLAALIQARRVVLAGVVLTELIRGARDESERETLNLGLRGVQYIEMGRDAWELAGWIAQQLDRQGNPVQMADILLAGMALVGDHEIFTRDQHFGRIPGLRLYDWTDPDA